MIQKLQVKSIESLNRDELKLIKRINDMLSWRIGYFISKVIRDENKIYGFETKDFIFYVDKSNNGQTHCPLFLLQRCMKVEKHLVIYFHALEELRKFNPRRCLKGVRKSMSGIIMVEFDYDSGVGLKRWYL